MPCLTLTQITHYLSAFVAWPLLNQHAINILQMNSNMKNTSRIMKYEPAEEEEEEGEEEGCLN